MRNRVSNYVNLTRNVLHAYINVVMCSTKIQQSYQSHDLRRLKCTILPHSYNSKIITIEEYFLAFSKGAPSMHSYSDWLQIFLGNALVVQVTNGHESICLTNMISIPLFLKYLYTTALWHYLSNGNEELKFFLDQ